MTWAKLRPHASVVTIADKLRAGMNPNDAERQRAAVGEEAEEKEGEEEGKEEVGCHRLRPRAPIDYNDDKEEEGEEEDETEVVEQEDAREEEEEMEEDESQEE